MMRLLSAPIRHIDLQTERHHTRRGPIGSFAAGGKLKRDILRYTAEAQRAVGRITTEITPFTARKRGG